MNITSRLQEIVGPENVSTEPGDLKTYGLDWTRFFQPAPIAIVFVRNTDQVIELVKFANREQVCLVPSGGRTGLSGGACATNGEVVVSFDRMNQIKAFDASDAAVVVEPGVVTAELQAFAKDQGCYYPVDFASSGSSQIGGNIATNAGGIRVLRYGLTRQWVSGLRVVTGNGDLLTLNKGLTKNATGYDLRHLFIGSEGTLGFIVEATMQLAPAPAAASVVLLAVPEMERCLSVLNEFKSLVTLNAFEFFSDNALAHVLEHSDLPQPFQEPSAFYVLLEFEHTSDLSVNAVTQAFEACLSAGHTTDGIISQSGQQSRQLWQYRERISESITPRTPYKNDVSVRISQVPAFLHEVNEITREHYPEFEIVWFGHIGDGNLHLNILKPVDWETAAFKRTCDELSQHVLAKVQQYDGSVSAEHGVGLLKKSHLHFSRSAEEIALLRAIKSQFDPAGIMNPGKLI